MQPEQELNVPQSSKNERQDPVRTETHRPDAPGFKKPSRHLIVEGASTFWPKKTISSSKANLADEVGESSMEIKALESLRETAKLTIHTYKVGKITHLHLVF